MHRLIAILFLITTLGTTINAQNSSEPLPSRVLLNGMDLVWQQRNRCSAAAFTMLLSYWNDDASYRNSVNRFNSNASDVSVSLDEMIAYAATYDLRAIARMGGTTDMLKRLVANGFPVLVENVYYDGARSFRNWTSHNRVVVGYDDTLQVIYALDSVLGGGANNTGRAFGYAEFEARWRPLNHNYLVIYKAEDTLRLRAIIGEHWDPLYNAEWTRDHVQSNLYAPERDVFDNFNLGIALSVLGEYQLAAQAFDVARVIGLPGRMLWYQFEPFEAYLQIGRTRDVLDLTRAIIAQEPGVEEMYYYIARAYLIEGNLEQTITNLEAAVWRNPFYTDAELLLSQVRNQVANATND